MAPLSEVCPPLTARTSSTGRADDVRPDEVAIVMAMGDSMTAGYNVLKPNFSEFRGWSFSSGAEPTANTVATFLKAYNPALIGGAMGWRKPSQKIGEYADVCPEKDFSICGLNAAVDGARVGWLHMQADWLEKRLESLANGTWRDDWKMVSIFTGLDDVVFGPSNNHSVTPPTRIDLLEQEFDQLFESFEARFPKLLVNVLALPENFSANTTVSKNECKLFKWISKKLGISWTDMSLWHDAILQYNQMLQRVVQRWHQRACTPSRCQMAVALRRPVLRTRIGLAELDAADCFHPNLRLAEAMAIDMWNEMWGGPMPDAELGLRWTQRPICAEPRHRFTAPNVDGILAEPRTAQVLV